MTRLPRRLAAFAVAVPLVVTLGVTAAPADALTSVKAAQRELTALGCSPGKIDGKLGTRTRGAIQKFQSAARIPMSGSLNARTRTALASATAPRCDIRPLPARSGTGRRMVISQRQNWLWLVAPDGTVLAQGGIIDNPAVVKAGTFRTGSKCGRPGRVKRNQDTDLRLWLDNYVRFGQCGEGLHRIPRSKVTGKQIHADWYLGTDLLVSHGCIRVSYAMSKRVWSFTTSPTKVVVVRG